MSDDRTPPKQIRYGKTMTSQLEWLRDRLNLTSDTDLIRYCVADVYHRIFNARPEPEKKTEKSAKKRRETS